MANLKDPEAPQSKYSKDKEAIALNMDDMADQKV